MMERQGITVVERVPLKQAKTRSTGPSSTKAHKSGHFCGGAKDMVLTKRGCGFRGNITHAALGAAASRSQARRR